LFYRYIIISTFAIGLKFIPNLYTNLAGGLINGISIGILSICYQKVMMETIPNEVTQQYGVLVNMGINVGNFLISLL